MYEIFLTIGAFCAVMAILGIVCERALMRRAQRRQYNDIDITGLYAHNDDRYGFAPVRNEPQLVMCGGCGHNIEPGNCPGAEHCQHFSIIKVAPGA